VDKAQSDIETWARCGAMWLTGRAEGPPVVPEFSVLARARIEEERLAWATAAWGRRVHTEVADLLTVRAGIAGLSRDGSISAGRSCRLLPTRDGRWIAINLARATDHEAVEGIVHAPIVDDPWEALRQAAIQSYSEVLVERARLLEVPAAVLGEARDRGVQRVPCREASVGQSAPVRDAPLIVDLSTMWAGPLCTWLLGRAGAQVVKVESSTRPDGARAGPKAFFDLLHDGHASVVLDFTSSHGVQTLKQLLAVADVIVNSARPRAMAQLGIDPAAVVCARPGTTWVDITAYGDGLEYAQRVGFGDDIAVAAGLVAWDSAKLPVFCADAIADPLSGLFAGAAAAASLAEGGGRLVQISICDVACQVAEGPPSHAHRVRRSRSGWRIETESWSAPILSPRVAMTTTHGGARPFGADTSRICADLLPQ
jgi:CoA-transferase family III